MRDAQKPDHISLNSLLNRLKAGNFVIPDFQREAASRLEFVESEKMNVYILQVMSILRQNYCSPKYLYFLLPGQKKSITSTMLM